jgi:hypothetical protein
MSFHRHALRLLVAGALAVAALLAPASADVLSEWNEAAAGLPAPDGSIVQLRALATAHAAAFDAVNAFEKRYAFYLSEFEAPAGASPEAAAATAVHGVLAALVPAEKARLDATLARLLAKIPDGAGKEAGLGFGREVAEAHLAERRKDRMDGKAEHIPGTQAGEWRPTPPGNFAMAAPHVVDVVPFTGKDFAFLQVKGPPALTSADYARDLAEVARLGARSSMERTGDQTLAAIFWSVSTAGPWEAAARAAAAAAKLDLVDSARLFALVNMAGVDGYYAGWQLKRKFNFWRPITAIHESADGDRAWQPLLTTPAHPDYPSRHTIGSGAMAQAIRKATGLDAVTFSSALALPTGQLIRSWTSIADAEGDVAGARLWAGIHFRSANEHGLALGHAIADRAADTVMRPRPPRG